MRKKSRRTLALFDKMQNRVSAFLDTDKGKEMLSQAGKTKEEYLSNLRKQAAESIVQAPKGKGFASNAANILAKKIAFDKKFENVVLDNVKDWIPSKIDDAIINAGMKANNWTLDTAISGLEGIAKTMDKSKQRQADANELASIILHNHNEWYLRFKGDNLAPLNYYDSVDEYVEFDKDNVKQLTPIIIRIPIQLVFPNDVKYAARLNQAFTANLTSLLNARGYGYTEYDTKDVANFIANIRYAVALLAVACRQLKVYSNYNTINLMEPDVLIAAHNTNHYTKPNIQIERSNLTSLKERVRLAIQNLKTITAGACPLYDRTLFLLSNFFKDSKSNKSCYFVFDLDSDEEDGVFTYAYHQGNSSTLQSTTVTYPDIENVTYILNTFDKLCYNAFVADYKAKQIRSDINYLFGITESTHYTKYFEQVYKDLDKPLKVLDDQKILLQIHNMRFNPRLSMKTSQTGQHTGYIYFDGSTRPTLYSMPLLFDSNNVFDDGGGVMIKRNMRYTKINAWKKLSADDLVSVTRFVNLPNAEFKITLAEDPNDSYVPCLKIQADGTLYEGKFENAIGAQVITYNNTFDGTNNQFRTDWLITAGNLLIPRAFDITTYQFWSYYRDLALWCWSYADWMPHVKTCLEVAVNDNADLEKITIIDFNLNANYRIMHDLDMCANISEAQLDPIDQVAMLSELIWTQNGNNIIDIMHQKKAKENKSSKDYRSNNDK